MWLVKRKVRFSTVSTVPITITTKKNIYYIKEREIKMKVSVLQENLDKALSSVSRLIQTNTSLPILSHILLRTQNGRLELQATNLELTILYKIGAKIETPGSLSVPAKLITELIHSLPNDKIQLNNQKDNLEVHTNQVNSLITSMSAVDFPSNPEVKVKQEFTLSTKQFLQGLEYVLPSVSLDESRPVLTGIYCKVEDNILTLATTDSYRLAQYQMSVPKIDDLKIIIPYRTIQELIRLIKQENISEITIGITDTEIIFTTENITLTSQLIEGNYPDYTKIIPENHTTTIEVKKEDLTASLKIASLFSRENANTIQLSARKNSLEILSEGLQIGKNTSEITIKLTGSDQEINLNARYIIDALSVIPDQSILIQLQDKLDPCLLTSPKSQKLKNFHIIMPLRS